MPKEQLPLELPFQSIPEINPDDGTAFEGPASEESMQALSRQNLRTAILFGSVAILCSSLAAAGFWMANKDPVPSASPEQGAPYASAGNPSGRPTTLPATKSTPSFLSPSSPANIPSTLPSASATITLTSPSAPQHPGIQSPNTQTSSPNALVTPGIEPETPPITPTTAQTKQAPAQTPPKATPTCPPTSGLSVICDSSKYATNAANRSDPVFQLEGQPISGIECYVRPANSNTPGDDRMIVTIGKEGSYQTGYVRRDEIRGNTTSYPECS